MDKAGKDFIRTYAGMSQLRNAMLLQLHIRTRSKRQFNMLTNTMLIKLHVQVCKVDKIKLRASERNFLLKYENC